MKTYRETFEENFKAVLELRENVRDVRMRYVYIGLWYVWNLSYRQVKVIKRLIGLACVLSVLLYIAGGIIHSPLNCARYVQLTGMLSIAALVFEAFGTVQFCAAKERMNCMDFRDIRGELLIAPLLHGILLICSVIAAIFEIFRNGVWGWDIIVVLCYFCSALLSLAIFLCIRSLPYRTEKNENAGIGLDDKE